MRHVVTVDEKVKEARALLNRFDARSKSSKSLRAWRDQVVSWLVRHPDVWVYADCDCLVTRSLEELFPILCKQKFYLGINDDKKAFLHSEGGALMTLALAKLEKDEREWAAQIVLYFHDITAKS